MELLRKQIPSLNMCMRELNLQGLEFREVVVEYFEAIFNRQFNHPAPLLAGESDYWTSPESGSVSKCVDTTLNGVI
ncbi:hypothetical protein [Paenibacillus sp. FSL H7-0331]|uniref:hypothetical protein n=1 Tax=Paenibacillus sp. FSL H7-0331 TaxID=1920421 RepID=UPI00096D1916|nr:hypothetical protein [Paenibacillus sp. FSL H7-0331]OMF09205.1 hypothetical protein BK127_26945 [Paenibacillus sp. FSL H7-0331]